MKIGGVSLACVAVPLLLAVGCAERHNSSVSYSPALGQTYPETSDRPSDRTYAEPPGGTEVTAPPPGATQEDWVLAEEIRGLLTRNEKLGTAPMAAVVKQGVVTLQGGVRNQRERAALREEIARLPGVRRVDDEMEFKNPIGNGPGETKSY